jgi:predicted secreted hydrolase
MTQRHDVSKFLSWWSYWGVFLVLLTTGSLFWWNGQMATANHQKPFKQALPGYQYEFPRDHASHPDYKTEWWYYTGHLEGENGKQYGYELTFFRASTEVQDLPKGSRWSVSQIYPAHFALSELSDNRFRFWERMNREGLEIAGARSDVYSVWNELWSVDRLGPQHVLRAQGLPPLDEKNQAPENKGLNIVSKDGSVMLNLVLAEGKPPAIHGKNGVSQKASCVGCASHYYSLTRMPTQGVLYLDGKPLVVSGQSWMDHEFGSNQLAQEQTGWDWFSLQLDNGEEWMFYLLRTTDGKPDPNSSGTAIAVDGQTRHLDLSEFQITPSQSWTSPNSKAVYPAQWRIQIPTEQVDLTLLPLMADQELNTAGSTGVSYWEGAVKITGQSHGKKVNGKGYVELTGYKEAFSKKI